jgi:hypothetical protein
MFLYLFLLIGSVCVLPLYAFLGDRCSCKLVISSLYNEGGISRSSSGGGGLPKRHSNSNDRDQRGSGSARKEFTKNNAANERRGEREWRSGEAFVAQRSRQRKNDPWWMREDEMTNPRVLPQYEPWWFAELDTVPAGADGGNLKGNIWVDDKWKLADLKLEAKRRGLVPAAKKELLISQLQESSRLHDLSDAGFIEAQVVPRSAFDESLSCFPEVYETTENYAALKLKVSQLNLPGAEKK